jgi:uncharacterized protein YjiS (DUF1127 family)
MTMPPFVALRQFTLPGSRPRIGRVASIIAALIRAPVAALRRRRAIHDLHALENRMLADIGIKRCQIETAVDRGRERF